MLHSAAHMKANWSCTACGMYSGRRYCVQRHIDNIHKGEANAIPFVEYLVGRRAGAYPPKLRPSYSSAKRTIMEKTEDEIENIYARRAAETFLPPVGAAVYLPFMPEVINRFRNRQNASNWTEFFEMLEILQKNESNVEATQGGTSKGAAQDDILNNDNILNNDVDLTHCKKKLENVSLSRRKRS